jgi:hypothetical protein
MINLIDENKIEIKSCADFCFGVLRIKGQDFKKNE